MEILDQEFLLFCSSKTICEEFIQLMAKKVKESIMADLKKSGYFSFSVDFTPDISHTEQLSLIIRYLFPVNSLPSEIFIIFFELKDHFGLGMVDISQLSLSLILINAQSSRMTMLQT